VSTSSTGFQPRIVPPFKPSSVRCGDSRDVRDCPAPDDGARLEPLDGRCETETNLVLDHARERVDRVLGVVVELAGRSRRGSRPPRAGAYDSS